MVASTDFDDLPLLKQLTSRPKASLYEKATSFSLAKDEVVFEEGAEATDVYFLLEGKVNLQTSTLQGKSVVTDVLKAQDLLGWSSVFRGAKMTATAICGSDCRLAKIQRSLFMGELLRHSDTGIQVMINVAEIVSRRLRESRSRLALHLSGSAGDSESGS